MGGFDRAERRRQERAAAKARTLFHGSAGAVLEEIERDGLRAGQEGRVYLTDSRAIARSYAIWEAARHPAPHIGVVLTVKASMLTVEQNSYPPPLPWETTMHGGVSYFTTTPIAPAMIVSVEEFVIEELRDDATLEAVVREAELICDALPRATAVGNAAPMIRRGGLHRAVPDHWGLLDALVEASPNAGSRWHGEAHWRGVLAAGVRLVERGCSADPAVLTAFALLHDSQRRSESHDPRHGERAADLADRLHDDALLALDNEQREKLRAALVDHDRGLTSTDTTIGACWDADRLTLGRVGITPDPALLSTAAARELAGERGRVPDGEACSWDWALSRMFLLAAAKPRRERVAAWVGGECVRGCGETR